jgi:protein-S-isoprenylcysteine O-methyltransferase Ste14
MNTNTSQSDQSLLGNIVKRMVQVALLVAFMAVVLFLSSGRLNWMWAWIFIGLNLIGVLINSIILLRYNPETIAERAEAEGMKDWDKIVSGLWAVTYYILMLLVAGLDTRFGWTPLLALALYVAGGIVFVLGFAFFSWAMISNAYFTAVVRIQAERGQTICTTGPYRFVRHPGYVGAIIQSLATPLLLGSLWALIPGGVAAILMVTRTALEDQTLHQELDGYRDYAQQVRYRLLPGIW